MQWVISSMFLTLSLDSLIRSLPINNGFSLKFNAPQSNEDSKIKQTGEYVVNSTQDLEAVSTARQRYISKTQYNPPFNIGIGCTNQIAQVVVPVQYRSLNETELDSTKNKVLHLPMVDHPYKDYKMLVATAPAHMKLGRNRDERLLVYVVFPDDQGNDSPFSVPTVYFVNQTSSKMFSPKGKRDPVFLVDNNRKVTNLNSKQISKFIKFKNKLSGPLV